MAQVVSCNCNFLISYFTRLGTWAHEEALKQIAEKDATEGTE